MIKKCDYCGGSGAVICSCRFGEVTTEDCTKCNGEGTHSCPVCGNEEQDI